MNACASCGSDNLAAAPTCVVCKSTLLPSCPGCGKRLPEGTVRSDYCATCAILAMLAGAQTASAPAVVLPATLASAEIVVPDQAVRIASRHFAFQSRAPPQS